MFDGVTSVEVGIGVDARAGRDARDAVAGVLAVEGDLVEMAVAGVDGFDLGIAEFRIANGLREHMRTDGGDDADMNRGIEVELTADGAAIDRGRGVIGGVAIVRDERFLEDREDAERFMHGGLDAKFAREVPRLRFLHRLRVRAQERTRRPDNAAVVEAVGGGSIRGDSPRGIPGEIRGAIHGEVYCAIDRICATIKECADGDAGDFIGIAAIPCHGAKCTLPQ